MLRQFFSCLWFVVLILYSSTESGLEGKGHATVSRMVLFCCYMVFVIILKMFLYVHQFAGNKRNEKYGLNLVYW
jgi:hypothetical protein